MSQSAPKVALVTGAARGIGLATAKRFLAEGWRVALLDIDGDNLQRTFKALGKPDVDHRHHLRRRRRRRRRARHRQRRETIRPARRAGQQCRHRHLQADPRRHLRGLVARAGGQPHRPVSVHAGRGAADARLRRRRHRQHHLDLGPARLHAAHRLRHQQGRPRAPDQAAGGRTRRARHPRQRGGARAGRHRHGESRAHAGDPRRLSRRHAAQPLRPGRGTGRSDLLPVQRARELHHRARRSRSTAASMRPASACRRCARRSATARPRRGRENFRCGFAGRWSRLRPTSRRPAPWRPRPATRRPQW